jgi:hypothetical protein
LAPPRKENEILRQAISSDYVHYLRTLLPGTAPVVYANGAIATVNPFPFLNDPPADEPILDGEAWARRFGRQIAERVVRLEHEREAVTVAAIAVRTERVRLPVDNPRFLLGYCVGIFGDRPFYYPGSKERLPPAGACGSPAGTELESEVSLIELGSVRLLALPGEIFPEFLVGYGRDGAGEPAIAAAGSCPPRIQDAPRGPHLRESLESGGRRLFVLGLTNDEIGYVVPEYDFVLDDEHPYLEKAKCGRHYHETNSLGPKTGSLVLEAIERLRLSAPLSAAEPISAASRAP